MQNSRPFMLVGVTGGIGSGKSTVCRAFERLGRVVISADEIARSLTETDARLREEIRAVFGPEVFRTDGSLDRGGLARIAFSSPAATGRLNTIVHPRVFEEIDRSLDGIALDRKKPYVVIEAALIYESGMDERLDRVVVVDAPEAVRIGRVVARDGLTANEVRQRIRAQWPAAEKIRLADMVIVNDRNAVALDTKVRFVDTLLAALPPQDLPDEEGPYPVS
jgi:dephospho-CoA kinase